MLMFFNIIGLILTWLIWIWLANRTFPPVVMGSIAIGGALSIIPLVYLGRWALDREPSVQRAVWVTTAIHYPLLTLLGSAVIEAVLLSESLELLNVRIPPWLGYVFMGLGALLGVLAVFNLALKGLGAPFAIALTRVVAVDWVYSWTRNPMIISVLAFLFGLGLWLSSAVFIIWVLAILSPALLVFLKVYEERELEIRFGQGYLEYKARTPMLFPGL